MCSQLSGIDSNLCWHRFYTFHTQRWEAWKSNFRWTDTQLNINTSILVIVLSDSNRFFISTADLISTIIRQKRGKPHTTTPQTPRYLTDIFLLLWRDEIEWKCWISVLRSVFCWYCTSNLDQIYPVCTLRLFIYREFTTWSSRKGSRKSWSLTILASFYGNSQLNQAMQGAN